MCNKCIKRCSIPLVIREITVMKYHCMYKIGYNFKEKKEKKKGEGINSGKDLYKLEPLIYFW